MRWVLKEVGWARTQAGVDLGAARVVLAAQNTELLRAATQGDFSDWLATNRSQLHTGNAMTHGQAGVCIICRRWLPSLS